MKLMLTLLLAGLVAGCNTFGAPEDADPNSDVGVDSGSTNVITMDGGSDPDLGMDGGSPSDAGSDEDAGDSGVDAGGPNWVPTVGTLPRIDAMLFPDELETCNPTPVKISVDLPDGSPDVHIMRIETEMERFAIVSVDRTGQLVVTEVDTAGNETIRHTSSFTVKDKTAGKVVAATAIGDQMIAVALTSEDETFAVQCEFVTGECRESDLELPDIDAVELFSIGPRYILLYSELMELWEVELEVSDEFELADGATNITVANGIVREIDAGLVGGGVPVVGLSVDIGAGTYNYEVWRFDGGAWVYRGAISPMTGPPIEASPVRPRMEFLSNTNVAWYHADSAVSEINVRNSQGLSMGWQDGQSVGDGIRDFDFSPIRNGFLELYSNSVGTTKININDGSMLSTEDRVMIGGNTLVSDNPARAAIADGVVGVVFRSVNELHFYTLCDESP